MRRCFVLLALPLTLAATVPAIVPASASAQRVAVGVAGGPSMPVGDLSDEAGTGFHLRGSFGLQIPLVPLGVRADLLWQQFPDAVAGDHTNLGGLLNATWRLPFPIVQPYLVGGAGTLRHSYPDVEHGDHDHEGEATNSFAFAVGGGVQLRLLGLGGFVEVRYLDWGEARRAIPLTFGIMF
jgi:opacity protein-like surface antigen